MTDNAVATREADDFTIAELDQLFLTGDLRQLSEYQRVRYYHAMCQRANIDPAMRPFEYLTLNNKLVLYPTRNATDQISAANLIDRKIISREKDEENRLLIVVAEATLPNGRKEQSMGVVSYEGTNQNGGGKFALRGEALANAWMKAETKAKRRATLSVTGLSMLDETEMESIPGRTQEAFTAHQIVIESEHLADDIDAGVVDLMDEPRSIAVLKEVLASVALPDMPAEWTDTEILDTLIAEAADYLASSCTKDQLVAKWNTIDAADRELAPVKAAFNRAKTGVTSGKAAPAGANN